MNSSSRCLKLTSLEFSDKTGNIEKDGKTISSSQHDKVNTDITR